MKRCILFACFTVMVLFVGAQRNYAPNSVLASGKWVKIATDSPGVYKVTGEFLQKAGFSLRLPAASIRLFGNGGGVLPESNQVVPADDLRENAIEVVDGGDGFLDATDHFLFYAPGADQWVYDAVSGQFRFQKNAYTASSFYFITVASTGSGMRVSDLPLLSGHSQVVDAYDEHYHHELDSINFLKSGKEWYGEDFSAQPGRLATREFTLNLPDQLSGSRFSLHSEVIGRSFGKPNTIDVLVNGQQLFRHTTATQVGTLLEPYASVSKGSGSGTLGAGSLKISYLFTPGSPNAESWLNWFDLFFRRSLQWREGTQLRFRDLSSLGKGKSLFQIKSSNAQLSVWDVTDPAAPRRARTAAVGQDLQFVADCSELREYIAFGNGLRIPKLISDIPNQNLHALPAQDMVIVTDPALRIQAERLAVFHRTRDGLKVAVVNADQVYNEFASGSPDPTAIRNFMKMFYDRSKTSQQAGPGYLLLFGGASYVYKEKSKTKFNLIPSYQSLSSLDPLTSYVTDDYFGYLDDQDDINVGFPAPLLDLAIGRIPARNPEQAKVAVDKIILYHQPAALGTWRNGITLVADDEDDNLHLQDAEFHARTIEEHSPSSQIEKIYLDAFEQQSGSGGSTYPSVNELIKRGLDKGTLLWNYSGHGSSTRLAQESIIEKAGLPFWQNQERLPLFITATCDFAPFDDPGLFSIGEELLVGRSSGAIALLTTTRLVFASSNKVINNNYFRFLFQKNAQGRYPTVGSSLKDSKNFTVVSAGDFINARKFTLLGDPAIKLAMPEHTVRTVSVNEKAVGADTLQALNRYSIKGEVLTPAGLVATDFNGYVYPRVYDKAGVVKTRANDPQSKSVAFSAWTNPIYDGKVKVEQGRFAFDFIVPRDIELGHGKGRISYYAENGQVDANGSEEGIVVGGLGGKAKNDGEGPAIQAFLDNENFTNGGQVGVSPLLLVRLSDASGIHISGVGIGHDISAVVDGNSRETIVLNEYFEAVYGTGHQGIIRFRLPEMQEGSHSIVIRAWDVFNNSSTYTLRFVVVRQKEILILGFSNFPNPFSSATSFSVGLDGPLVGSALQLNITDLNGRRIRTIARTINDAAVRSFTIDWDGKDESGKRLQRGVYIAQLVARSREGKESRKLRKLIIH